MVVSEKEALYRISHEEQLYEWGRLYRETLKGQLAYFIGVLSDYNYSKAVDECNRVNRKYGFSISIE